MLFFKGHNSKNVIDENSKFTGMLKAKNSVTIKGYFSGKIETEDNLKITETASVKADIKCDNLTLQGHLEGNIDVENEFIIEENAEFSGEIIAAKIIFDQDAKLTITSPLLVTENEEK